MPTLIDRIASFVDGPAPTFPGSNYGADGAGVYIQTAEGAYELYQLIDSDRPKQGVQVRGKLRINRTNYPGNSRPGVQILGTAEDDLVLEGTFRDDLANENGHAMAQMARFRALYLAHTLVSIEWGSALVRRGYLREPQFTVNSERWIDYSLTFEVVEADEAAILAQPFAPVVTGFDLLATLHAIESAVEEVSSQVTLINNVASALL